MGNKFNMITIRTNLIYHNQDGWFYLGSMALFSDSFFLATFIHPISKTENIISEDLIPLEDRGFYQFKRIKLEEVILNIENIIPVEIENLPDWIFIFENKKEN